MKDNLPDKDGFFGEYGGKFVPETLMYLSLIHISEPTRLR